MKPIKLVIIGVASGPSDSAAAMMGRDRAAQIIAVHGDRKMALQALLIDPVVDCLNVVEKMLDELLAVHKEYLPLFSSR